MNVNGIIAEVTNNGLLTLIDQAPIVTLLWVSAVGSCIGSFMNVVIYRIPARMSLSHPGSRCPSCGHAIRPRDNVPIIGWILLRGRFRDCQQAISVRYPIVEAIVMMAFATLWVTNVMRPDDLTTAARVGSFSLQILLVCTLFCVAMIDFDGQPIRYVVWVPTALLLATAISIWPPLRLQDATSDSLAMTLLCTVTGFTLGYACSRFRVERQAYLIVMGLTGLYVGWFWAVPIAAGASGIWLVTRIVARLRSMTWSLCACWALSLVLATRPQLPTGPVSTFLVVILLLVTAVYSRSVKPLQAS